MQQLRQPMGMGDEQPTMPVKQKQPKPNQDPNGGMPPIVIPPPAQLGPFQPLQQQTAQQRPPMGPQGEPDIMAMLQQLLGGLGGSPQGY